MSGLNKVMILGRLGADPDFKTLQNNQSVATLSIATSEKWKDKDGNAQERTEWHRVVFWGKQAETINKFVTKGRELFVEGKLQTRQWEDQQGQKRYTTEIVGQNFSFVGSQNSGGGAGGRDDQPSFDQEEPIPF